jgi:hypothetical protein
VSRTLIRGRLILCAQSALLIAGGLLLGLSLDYGGAPFALAVPLLAIGIAWRALTVGRIPTVPRKLADAAYVLFLIAGSLVVVRIITGHAWLPNGIGSVMSFAAAELFLVPAALLLLVVGLGWHLVVRAKPKAASPPGSNAAAANAATALLVLAAMLLVGWQATPRIFRPLSRNLEWGRYGFGPPVRLTSLTMLTADAGITFPADAVLLDGEFVGGIQRYIIAKVRIPNDSVDTFLAHQRAPFSWTQVSHGRAAVQQFRAMRYGGRQLMNQRGWHPDMVRQAIFADGSAGPGREADCWVLIDLDSPGTAVLYITWSPI